MSILINGKTFDWGDITISLLPTSSAIFTAKEISWDEEFEATAVYGKGRVPVGFGKGNWRASGKISLLKNEFEALALVVPNGILNMDPRSTHINVLYGNSFDSSIPLSTTTLTGIRFTKVSEAAIQGDKELKVSLEFLILDNVRHNGKATRGAASLN